MGKIPYLFWESYYQMTQDLCFTINNPFEHIPIVAVIEERVSKEWWSLPFLMGMSPVFIIDSLSFPGNDSDPVLYLTMSILRFERSLSNSLNLMSDFDRLSPPGSIRPLPPTENRLNRESSSSASSSLKLVRPPYSSK